MSVGARMATQALRLSQNLLDVAAADMVRWQTGGRELIDALPRSAARVSMCPLVPAKLVK